MLLGLLMIDRNIIINFREVYNFIKIIIFKEFNNSPNGPNK